MNAKEVRELTFNSTYQKIMDRIKDAALDGKTIVKISEKCYTEAHKAFLREEGFIVVQYEDYIEVTW